MISPLVLETAVLLLGLLLLLVEAFADGADKSRLAWAGIVGLGAVLVLSFFTVPETAATAARFYRADPQALFFKRLALLTTMIVLVMALEYRDVVSRYLYSARPGAGLGEFYALPIFTCAGLMWMASAVDFIMIFVSLELVTVSFYVLVAYMRRNASSLEAGVKYLILSALSTGFLVYGITWIFGVTGETNLDRIGAAMLRLPGPPAPLLFGFMLVIVALGFKIAAAPFQLWVADVYQGAPTPITAFLSVGSKAAGFLVLLRVLDPFLAVPMLREKVLALLVILAALTLIYGNFAALPQGNLKRLLAYSSIAHAGYLLIAVASVGSGRSGITVAFYLAGYLLMTLLSFVVITAVSRHGEGDEIAHFNGLGRRSPILAFGLLTAMLSLAGVPFTVGFLGKFFVFEAAMAQRQYLLVGLGVITVAAGFYYYLKVVRAMYWLEGASDAPMPISGLTRGTVLVLAAAVFVFGIYPQPIFAMLKPAAPAAIAMAPAAP